MHYSSANSDVFGHVYQLLQSNIFIFSSLSYPKLVSGSCFFLRPLWHRQSYPYSRPQQAHNNPLSFCSSPCHLSTLFLELCYSFQLPICIPFVLNSSPPHLVWSISFPFPLKFYSHELEISKSSCHAKADKSTKQKKAYY